MREERCIKKRVLSRNLRNTVTKETFIQKTFRILRARPLNLSLIRVSPFYSNHLQQKRAMQSTEKNWCLLTGERYTRGGGHNGKSWAMPQSGGEPSWIPTSPPAGSGHQPPGPFATRVTHKYGRKQNFIVGGERQKTKRASLVRTRVRQRTDFPHPGETTQARARVIQYSKPGGENPELFSSFELRTFLGAVLRGSFEAATL